MIVRSESGKYEMRVDKQRRIVYEKVVGMMSREDFESFASDYKNKILPYLSSGSWSKVSDFRKNIPNTQVSPDIINAYAKWAAENGFKCAAIIVESVTMKM